jgi:hypothetical protein
LGGLILNLCTYFLLVCWFCTTRTRTGREIYNCFWKRFMAVFRRMTDEEVMWNGNRNQMDVYHLVSIALAFVAGVEETNKLFVWLITHIWSQSCYILYCVDNWEAMIRFCFPSCYRCAFNLWSYICLIYLQNGIKISHLEAN